MTDEGAAGTYGLPEGPVAVREILRRKLHPKVFLLIEDSHCRWFAEKGYTFPEVLEGITMEQLPSHTFSDPLCFQLARAFAPPEGATKRLSATDATDKSAVYDLAGTYGNAGQAPSGLSLPETFDRTQRRDLFLCGIPAHLKGLPAALENIIFGQFQDNSQHLMVDSDACRTAAHFFQIMSMPHFKEHGLRDSVNAVLNKYLDGPPIVRFGPAGNLSTSETDGTMVDDDRRFAVLWADYKRCVGQGGSDSWRENMLHFYVWVNHMHVTLPSDYHWPGLGLEVVAPHVRVSALFSNERVHCNSMTPFVEFLDHINSNQQQVLQAARLLQSMKIATAELVAEAEAWCSASPPPVLSSAAFAPYPLRNPAKYREVHWLLREHGYAGVRKLLYHVTTVEGVTLCVKFTQQYNQRVHAAWAQAGLAPDLVSVETLPGGWHMVSMELLGQGWACLDELLLAGRSSPQIEEAAVKALAEGHKLRVPMGTRKGSRGKQTALGDSRTANVMVRTDSQNPSEVKFVDFEWAGVAGAARYPAYMNHVTIPWPAGAREGLPLTAAKDTAVLQATIKSAQHLSRRPHLAPAALHIVNANHSLLRLRIRSPNCVVRSSCVIAKRLHW